MSDFKFSEFDKKLLTEQISDRVNEEMLRDYEYVSELDEYISTFDINTIPEKYRKKAYIDYEPYIDELLNTTYDDDILKAFSCSIINPETLEESAFDNVEDKKQDKFNEKQTELLKHAFDFIKDTLKVSNWQFSIDTHKHVVTGEIKFSMPIDQFGIIIPNINNNVNNIKRLIESRGYFVSKIVNKLDDKGRKWVSVLCDPYEQYPVNNIIKKCNFKYFVHSSPIIYKEDQMKFGLFPRKSNPNHLYYYPERLFFGITHNVSEIFKNRKYTSMMSSIASRNIENNPDREYVIYLINIDRIINDIKFYRDKRAAMEDAFYTNDTIPPIFLNNNITVTF